MFAAGLFKQKKDPVSPTTARLSDGSPDDGGLPKEKVQFKARLKEAGEVMMHNLYLDKIFKKKDEKGAEPSDGEVGYLGSPSLDEIEAQLLTSAIEFQRNQGGEVFAGPDEDDYEERSSMMALAADEEDEEEGRFPGGSGASDFEFAGGDYEFHESM